MKQTEAIISIVVNLVFLAFFIYAKTPGNTFSVKSKQIPEHRCTIMENKVSMDKFLNQ